MRQKTKQTMAKDESKEDEDNDADDDDEGIAEAQLSSSTSLSIAQRFHHDGIHSILSFLNMRELNRAAQTCKQWLNAATNPSFHLPSTVDVRATLPKLRAIITSPLRDHMSKLTVTQPLTSINDLRRLHVLEELSGLDVEINIRQAQQTPHRPIRLPPNLETLSISVYAAKDGALSPSDAVVRGVQQPLINAIAAVPTLTSLDLYLRGKSVELDYTPLINLIILEQLELSLPVSTAAVAMNTVKRLPMLEFLSIQTSNRGESPPTHASILHSLCSSPAPTKLETLVLDWRVTAEHIPILAHLPSLTAMDAEVDDAAAPHLPLLTQLETLDFSPNYEQSADPFLPFIPQLRQLTTLALYDCSLSDEQGALIMAGCKRLTSLELGIAQVESLSWLVTPDSCVNLTSLHIYGRDGIDASDVISILELKSLQKLILQFTWRLDALTQRALTPPTPFLPSLTEFEYEEPEAEDEAEE